jgi:hypothetical protein
MPNFALIRGLSSLSLQFSICKATKAAGGNCEDTPGPFSMNSNYGVGSAILFLWFDAVVFFALVLLVERLQRPGTAAPAEGARGAC